MQRGGIRILTALKRFGFVFQMLPNHRKLIHCVRFLDDDALHTASDSHPKDVSSFGKIKGHYARAHMMNVFLFGLSQTYGTGDDQESRN